jgi:hypothetical protein
MSNPSVARAIWIGLLLVAATSVSACMSYSSRRPRVSGEIIESRVTYSGDNFRVAQSHVEGHASCSFLLFLPFPTTWQREIGLPLALGIPLGQPALLEEAMADLHSKVDLVGKPQILSEVIEEWTFVTYFGLYGTMEIKVSAEVVEFVEEPEARGGA